MLWTRALAVLIGSSIFSFTIILLAFLVGLGFGSAVFGRIGQRTRHPVRWLAAVHLGIAGMSGFSYLITDQLPLMFAWLLASTSFGVDAVLLCQFVARVRDRAAGDHPDGRHLPADHCASCQATWTRSGTTSASRTR